jgi:glycosyltransferase involved in cell wall biosynthesis
LIARFDESKGMDKAMALGVKTRQKMRDSGVPEAQLPQIIIVGNGSVDDPSGVPMFEKMLQIRRNQYPNDKKDIIIMLLRHNYKAINALMHQTINKKIRQPSQIIALQTSEAEGCETRISDWIRHGVPVVVSNRGGMSLQVVEGKSGLVLDFDKPDYDIERGALFISHLMVDDKKYATMTKSTKELAESFNNREFTTTANATRLLRVFCSAINGKKADKIWKISEMININ